jgi:hypothetical protein
MSLHDEHKHRKIKKKIDLQIKARQTPAWRQDRFSKPRLLGEEQYSVNEKGRAEEVHTCRSDEAPHTIRKHTLISGTAAATVQFIKP